MKHLLDFSLFEIKKSAKNLAPKDAIYGYLNGAGGRGLILLKIEDKNFARNTEIERKDSFASGSGYLNILTRG